MRARSSGRVIGALCLHCASVICKLASQVKDITSFKEWLVETHGSTLESIMREGAECTAEKLAEYGGCEFRAGGTKGEYVATINAVADLRRAWRLALTPAWDVVSEWTLREPGKPRVPVPEAGVRAAITLACCLRWTAFALFLALGWCAVLRPTKTPL